MAEDPGSTKILLERWHRGDRKALEVLLIEELPFVRRKVHQLLGPKLRRFGETEDFTDDVFVKALEYVPRFKISSRSLFRAILSRIAVNAIRDAARKLDAKWRDQTVVLDLDPPDPATSPTKIAVRKERAGRVRLALELLDADDREAIILRHYLELPFEEVGKRLGVTTDAARMRFNRALVRLAVAVRVLRKGNLESLLGPRTLVILHEPSEGPGTLRSFLEDFKAGIQTVRLYDGERLPESAAKLDLVVSMGGPMSVYDDQAHPFLAAEAAFIRDTIERDIAVVGICLGAQMIARACGARVVRSPAPEVGWGTVSLTGAGKESQWLVGLPESLTVFQWHEDMFDVPEGGELLASSDACPHQAFSYGSALGLQFHVEVSREMIADWLAGKPELEGMLRRHDEIGHELAAHSKTLYSNLLRRIV